MATSILLKFLTLKWNISRTIGRIEVGDDSFLCIFHALSFELNIFFDRRFPLRDACEFDFTIMFVRGVDNKMADSLTHLGYEFSPTVQHSENELEKLAHMK